MLSKHAKMTRIYNIYSYLARYMYLVDTHAICIITKLACRFINSRNFIWFYNSNSSWGISCVVLSLSLFLPLSFAPVCFLFIFFFECRKCCPGQQYSIKCHKIKSHATLFALPMCNLPTHHIRGIPGTVLILKFLLKLLSIHNFFDILSSFAYY